MSGPVTFPSGIRAAARTTMTAPVARLMPA
jgi:hypothetical protein